ncbi:hypothetical protein IAU60_001224 [Kwoniella sp. DSM 27419]
MPLAPAANGSRPGSTKPGTPISSTSNCSLILRKQLLDLQKNPVDGFSAGLVDDDNILEWQIVIMGPADTLYEGAILKARLIFPPEFPLLPPRMIFDSEMWHPNGRQAGRGLRVHFAPTGRGRSVLISVISLLSQDTPDLSSPANVDAAKEVREDFACEWDAASARTDPAAYKKKVKRLARRSAEEAYD